MKRKQAHANHYAFILAAVPVLFSTWDLRADIMYWPSEYNSVFNDKVALELELKTLKREYSNEKAMLESDKKKLETEIELLNKKIKNLENQMEEEKANCRRQVAELKKSNDILKKKGSARERELVDENNRLQKQCGDDMQALQDKFNKERAANIRELEELRKKYEEQISDLNGRINNLNNELSALKKLTETQKEELNRLESQAKDLEKQLQEEIKRGEIRLKRFHDKLIINLDDKICFDSGSAKLKGEVLPALKKIMKILAKYPENRIVVEGHTDNVPIHTAKFRDNWQLSTERALSVLNYLLKPADLAPTRFSAAGYGEYQPIVPNDTRENRALNRRVDIVVIPRVTK